MKGWMMAVLSASALMPLRVTEALPPIAHVAATQATGELPRRGQLSRIQIAPAKAGAAALIITGTPGVRFRPRAVPGQPRIIVDVIGAQIGIANPQYDGLVRGPIRNLQVAQPHPDTVRLTLELEKEYYFGTSETATQMVLVLDGARAEFPRWSRSAGSGSETPSAPPAAVPAAAPVAPKPAPVTPKPVTVAPNPVPDAPKPVPVAPKAAPVADQAMRRDTVKFDKPKTEAVKVEPAKTEPPKTEAPKTEPAKVAPPKVELAKPEPAKTEPTKAEAESPMIGRGASAPRGQTQPSGKKRITITFDQVEIREVIAAFAAFSGRTIIPGREVTGLVQADIRDKPWDVALQALLQAYGLAASEDASGIITIDSYKNLAANQAVEPLVTQIVDVNYAKANALQNTVAALLARDCTTMGAPSGGRQPSAGTAMVGGGQSNQGCLVRGSVTADSATNKLIITDVPSRLPEIIARLRELDVRTPQVNIRAKIVFVNRTGIQDIGLAYDLGTGTKQFFQQLVPRIDPSTLKAVDTDGDGVPDALGGGEAYKGPARIALGGNALAGIANANNAIKPNALNLIYSTALGRYQLTAFLNALQTSSLADIQSEPSVTILNNRNAEIFVGQEIPIRVIDASSGGGGQGGAGGGAQGGQPNAQAFFPRATVSKEEAGIKLSVTPQVTNNRMVMLNIKAENSSAELAATDVGVIFNRQRAESQVLVNDGEAAVIGGLTVTETTRYRSGIPVLMNLPWIGRIFSQNTKNEIKRDLLILVTPHILEDGGPPPANR